MSDYRFRCADCGKVNQCHSTGHVPEFGEKVECINCGRMSIVEHQNVILEVTKSDEKVSPSQIEKLEQLKTKRDGLNVKREEK